MHVKDFLRTGHKPTLAMAFLYFDVSFMVWVMLGALGNFVAQQFGLTPTQKGLMTAIPVLFGALLRVPFGMLGDRIGAKKAGMLGMALTSLPLLWGWLAARQWSDVLAMGVLLGVAGASFAVALPLASRWYPPQYQGLAMGVAGAGNSGTLLATFFGPRLAERVGWHGVFGLALLPLAATLLAFALLARDSPSHPAPRRWADYFRVLRERDAILFCLFYSVTFGGFVGLASYLSIFFFDQYGLSRVRAGDFTTLCVLAGSMFRPVGGYLADRLGGIRLLTFLYACVAALMLGVSRLPPLGLVTVLLFLGMQALGMGNGAVFQLVPQRFGREIGVVTGLVGAAGGVGGFLLPMLLGGLKDAAGSYGAGFAAFALLAVGALAVLAVVQRSWTRSWVLAGGRARRLPEAEAT